MEDDDMGFDIKARKPTGKDEADHWYQNNCWGWRPLATYVLEHVSIPAKERVYWQSNDGQKVSASSAVRIADHIGAAAASGELAATWPNGMHGSRPCLPCKYCNQTGTRLARQP
jgi:hypothetical protein